MKRLFTLLLATMFTSLFVLGQNYVYVPKAIKVKTESVKVNGTFNAAFGGNSRVLIEVPLPPGTVEWYFSFKTNRDKQSEQNISDAIGLTTKVAALLTSAYTGGYSVKFSGLAESSIKSLAITKGQVPVNVYGFDLYNSQVFLKGDGATVIPGTYNVSQSEGNSLVKYFKSGTAYIGIDNPNVRTGAWVDVEVTATVLERRINNNVDQSIMTSYSRSEFIGKWKDENSTFTLTDDGYIFIRWDNGKTAGGRWKLINNTLNFDFSTVESNTYKRNDYYNILHWDGANLKYQHTLNGAVGPIYNATKISQ